MSSMSKSFSNNEKESCGYRAEEAKALLKCKVSNPVTITATSGVTAGILGTAVLTSRLATLSLDTGRFHDPCIKFEFSTNLGVTPGVATAVDVTFQLNKLCKGEVVATAVGNPWVYSTTATVTDIITFILCDCDCDCDSGCCTYFISASTVATLVATAEEGATTSTVTFNNPTLSALVVER